MSARQNASGGLLLLEEQDRSLWDKQGIQTGLEWLAMSAQGDTLSRYHAEAGIVAEHCLAASLEDTRWDKIVEYYSILERIAPSELHTLNRAVAIAEWHGPAEGLAVLNGFAPPGWLARSYQWSAVRAYLYHRCGNFKAAQQYPASALNSAPSGPVKELLERRLKP